MAWLLRRKPLKQANDGKRGHTPGIWHGS